MKRYGKSRYMIFLAMLFSGCVGAWPPQSTERAQLDVAIETKTYFEQTLKQIVVLKIDPNQSIFRTHYSAAQPLTLTEWG